MRGGARGSGGNGVHGEAEQLVSTRLALVCEFVRRSGLVRVYFFLGEESIL